jgi:hypothetical protein
MQFVIQVEPEDGDAQNTDTFLRNKRNSQLTTRKS